MAWKCIFLGFFFVVVVVVVVEILEFYGEIQRKYDWKCTYKP